MNKKTYVFRRIVPSNIQAQLLVHFSPLKAKRDLIEALITCTSMTVSNLANYFLFAFQQAGITYVRLRRSSHCWLKLELK